MAVGLDWPIHCHWDGFVACGFESLLLGSIHCRWVRVDGFESLSLGSIHRRRVGFVVDGWYLSLGVVVVLIHHLWDGFAVVQLDSLTLARFIVIVIVISSRPRVLPLPSLLEWH